MPGEAAQCARLVAAVAVAVAVGGAEEGQRFGPQQRAVPLQKDGGAAAQQGLGVGAPPWRVLYRTLPGGGKKGTQKPRSPQQRRPQTAAARVQELGLQVLR